MRADRVLGPTRRRSALVQGDMVHERWFGIPERHAVEGPAVGRRAPVAEARDRQVWRIRAALSTVRNSFEPVRDRLLQSDERGAPLVHAEPENARTARRRKDARPTETQGEGWRGER